MTAVDTTTGELVDAPSYGEVRESVDSAKSSLEAAAEQIVWQIEHRAWLVLGYADWNEMRESEYGGAAFMVPRAERPELVARMRRSGLTQQEIADTAGVDQKTVHRDLNRHLPNEDESSVPIVNARGQQRPASYTKKTPDQPEHARSEDAVHPACPSCDLPFSEDRFNLSDTECDDCATVHSLTDAPQERPLAPVPRPADEWTEQDRAEELAANLAAHVSALYALTDNERRAEYIALWHLGVDHRPVLGQKYVEPTTMRRIADALRTFAHEWEQANA